MIARDQYISIETMVPTQDKKKRARPLQARMRAGGVLFDKEAPWYEALYNEMIVFDRGRYADQVDAFSWIGLGLNKISPAYSANEIAEFEYDDEYGPTQDVYGGGRNRTTGY
jgi:hypothetical protein